MFVDIDYIVEHVIGFVVNKSGSPSTTTVFRRPQPEFTNPRMHGLQLSGRLASVQSVSSVVSARYVIELGKFEGCTDKGDSVIKIFMANDVLGSRILQA